MVAVEFRNIQPFGPSNVLQLPMNTFSVSPIKRFNEEIDPKVLHAIKGAFDILWLGFGAVQSPGPESPHPTGEFDVLFPLRMI